MKTMYRPLVTGVLLVSGSLLAAGAALAEDVVPPAPASDSAGADGNSIIVTARRRSESLQTTPVAISAVNTAMLENKAAANLGDLQGAAPGLLITQQNSGAQAANLSIRGLTYADVEKAQTPTVGVVIDGVTIGTNTGQLQDVFDVAQIEVLRGPQGTLFGANTIGGVINIQRSKPTMEPGAKVEFTYGQWNTWSGKGLVNYGNGTSWGVKAWYFHNKTDGFYTNALTGKAAGGSQDDNYGASLLFKPVGSMYDMQLTVENVVQSFEPVNSSIMNSSELFCGFVPAGACNRNTTNDLYTVYDAPAYSHYHAPAVTLEQNYNAGWIKLTAITGWRHSHEEQTQDFATDGLYYVLRKQHYTQISQELRASGKLFKGFDYVMGGFFFDSNYDLTQWTNVFGGSGLYTAADPSAQAPGQQIESGHTQSYALFGDFNWQLMDKVRLAFGGRWSHDNKVLSNGYACTATVGGVTSNTGVFCPVGNGNANFSKFTPKVGLDYRPTRDVMVYGSWSRGYRSGGFSPRAATPQYAATPFQPETVDAYELGAKLDLFQHVWQLNLAGFISDYKNMQQNLTVPGGPTGNQTITGNVPGGAIIKGIEMDSTLHVTPNLKLTATASLMESHFRNFVLGCAVGAGVGTCDYSGNRLIYAPTFSGSLNAEYTQPTSFGKVVTSVGWRHISPYDEQISQAVLPTSTTVVNNIGGNDPRVRTITQDLVDASLTVDFKLGPTDAYARVFGRNLADVRTTTAAFTVAGLWSFASAVEPRTWGVTLGAKF